MMTRIGLLTCVALPALLLTACKDNRGAPTAADSPSTNTVVSTGSTGEIGPAPVPTPVTDASAKRAPDYLAQAGAGDLFEIESSKAVMARTKNARIREFATMMVKAHEESTARLKAAADASKLPVKPPVLMPEQQSMLEGIKSASPASVDAVYIANQKTAHQAALALHQDYAARGDIPALKDAAGEIVPVVRSHIEHLAQLSSQ